MYNLDGTNSYLNQTFGYCDTEISTYSTEDENFATKSNVRNLNYMEKLKIYPKETDGNNSFEESLRLTKCCTEKYFAFLENKIKNSTTIVKVLDVFLGTVELIFFIFLSNFIFIQTFFYQ